MTSISIKATILKPIDLVWQTYSDPDHMVHWNFASDDWHCPSAFSDFRKGGFFTSKMAAKDGSFEFDFEGIYDEIIKNEKIVYHMPDGRMVYVEFKSEHNHTVVTVTFDLENENDPELQRQGWQAILNNFKTYTESLTV